MTFELWDGPRLAATTFGFASGCAFHDFTMATFIRDSRSPGAVLSLAVGHILQNCGFGLWYWGFKGEYMTRYDQYGGKDFGRDDFSEIWTTLCHSEPSISIRDFIANGRALVPPLESSNGNGRFRMT